MGKTEMPVTMHCDFIAINTYSRLARDLGLTEEFSKQINALEQGRISDFRAFEPREFGLVSPWRFKTYTQMRDLFKRYRFEHDALTVRQVEEKTLNAELVEQMRLGVHQWQPRPSWLRPILALARRKARSILGKYSEEEVIKHARFGRKASIGCSLASAYIDNKLLDRDAYTSTQHGYDWFRKYILSQDYILARQFADRTPVIIESLIYQLVPKTWDKFRGITPYPLIDLYFSFGVGGVVEERLADIGLNLSRLPQRHRRLVKEHSVNGSLATGDLSNASGTIVLWILNSVLPRDWYRAVRATTFRYIEVDGHKSYTLSVLPMGNGCTFPVETLVFYCVTAAAAELLGVKGLISVFGDDLIYPVRLHKFLVKIYTALGFRFNLSKTYAHYPFRESCGEDYYRGVAVRPALLRESEGYRLSGNRLHSHLYKWVNVLLARWRYSQIRSTVDYLLSLINTTGGEILRVPPLYPDQSGLKVEHPMLKLSPWLNYRPVYIRFADGSRWYEFSHLSLTYKGRVVRSSEPYYWLTLSGGSDAIRGEWTENWRSWGEAPREQLTWFKIQRKPLTLPNGRLKKRKPKICYMVRSRVLKEVVLREVLPLSPDEAASKRAFSDWTVGIMA